MANPPPSSQSSPIFPPVETNTLPQDLLLEILLRLPVKSLVRFRAVHTSWQSLFQNPNFISAHFRRSSLLSPRKVLLHVEFPESEEEATFFLSGDTLDAADTSEIYNFVIEEMYLLGSCCGVFCVTDAYWEKFVLWNPATREIMVLPPPLLQNSDSDTIWHDCVAVGFGLDPQGSDLKVVRLIFYDCLHSYCAAEVYSLKSSCWRLIQVDVEYLTNVMYGENHTYCNGSYHWVISRDGKMLSFDMTREVFELNELPIKDFWICRRFSGCLLAINPNDPSMDVWSMVESKNWKLVKEFEPYLNGSRFLMPLWRDDDEILYVMEEGEDDEDEEDEEEKEEKEEKEDHDYENAGGELFFLNITKQEVRKFNLGKGRALQLLPYVESLVSLRNWTRWCNYQA